MKEFFKHITWKNALRVLLIVFFLVVAFMWGIFGLGAIPLFFAIISIFDIEWE